MDLTTVYQFVLEHGYAALFILFAIGLFVFPVPNEVLLMAGGYFSTYSFLSPLPAFLTIFSAIFLHGTILYSIGYFANKKVIPHTETAKKPTVWTKRAIKGMELLERFGLKAASFSYFFPFARHAVPFSVGLARFRYLQFVLIAHSSALVWLSLYFFLGFHYGRTITDWTSFVEQLIFTLVGVALVVLTILIIKNKRKKYQTTNKVAE
ncbi:hypothetical protein BALCAV_0202975 [Alkalihalobacillus alcalophilus ATCC 27647 = CGMCC 1.3604]|nr:DedA family protein [Alkalihalobacillus alcalophilus]KGA98730.1 hypothetical protein BALCAV_0202975 [Alkalihalobacillus alcalophilus ATCC 27647 = CGMCC 1.3604]MED1562343.1 DedA family protein [Alkalihalobacillus alcalophilus]